MIFEVLAQIAFVASLDERLLDFWIFNVNKLFQFGHNLVIAFFRHIFHNFPIVGLLQDHTTNLDAISIRDANEINAGGQALWAGITAREALAQVHNRAFATAQNDYIASIPSSKEGFFNAIVDENAWELVGEGIRKFDLERWNLLVAKIKEAKQTYYDAIGLVSYDTKEDGSATNIEQNNKWPTKFYFNYTDDTKTVIDWKSVNWYTLTEGKSAADFHCTDSVNGWGKFTIEQYITNMPTISAGLVENPQVINRYLLPISTSTLSDANNTISNSYGY